MKLIIDDAHIDLIKKIYEYYPVDGVTTNPSILPKSGRQPFEVLKEIRSFIDQPKKISTLLLLLSILQCRLILLQNAVHPTQLHM